MKFLNSVWKAKHKKNTFFVYLPFIIVAVLAACSSTSNVPPPAWVTNVQSVYPWDAYITGRGDGSTRQDAEAKAMAEIALYFIRETTVERSRRASWIERDGVSSSESITEENILIESQTRLVAVRYAENPWYNRTAKSWETVAYIEREEGWSVYEPAARIQANAFLNLVKLADEETEPFNAVLRYGTAAAYARSADFNAVRDFAQVLHPAQAQILFANTDSTLMTLMQKQLLAQERAVVSIQCPIDLDRMIYQAMVKTLGASGFAAEGSGNADTVCVVQVEEGIQANDIGTFYYPSLTVTINGRSGAMMSFRVTADRVGAVTPDVAKRRAYTALASALEGAFPAELQRWQSALIRQ
uniref:Lipoprotein n=1 Tax=uncultured bacterium contig00053 TaxID=1181537 RepID=A0A806KJV9_9BACT|nr:hypothetical protein [uncultured bacterium contig00053]